MCQITLFGIIPLPLVAILEFHYFYLPMLKIITHSTTICLIILKFLLVDYLVLMFFTILSLMTTNLDNVFCLHMSIYLVISGSVLENDFWTPPPFYHFCIHDHFFSRKLVYIFRVRLG